MDLIDFETLLEALTQCLAAAEHLVSLQEVEDEYLTVLLKFGIIERQFRVRAVDLRKALKDVGTA